MQRLLVMMMVVLAAASAAAQGFDDEPVFRVRLEADREPLVAGESARLAVVIRVERGWHVNSHRPGDDFSVPTSLAWSVPEGWLVAVEGYPPGIPIQFDFAEQPISVWEGSVVIPATVRVPADAGGSAAIAVTVTAQACNDTQCLPPVEVGARLEPTVAPPETAATATNQELFAAAEQALPEGAGETTAADAPGGSLESELADRSLPLLLIAVFLGGLALNLTPCVFPLIPITIGFFSQQSRDRTGGTFPLALAYVLGIAATYSVLGVLAALGGSLFGAALQSPWVIGVIVAVLLALATSMFGLWELRVPGWAQRASGGRGGVFGALIMGLLMGFVAAPCIGPFVIGLLTLVGQRGDAGFGFLVFFVLALGLGVPYLLLGTFTGLVTRLPASGMWMVGVRHVFGVILIAMAAYFAAPLLPGDTGGWLVAAVLVVGALYLLVVDRTGHEQPAIDRAVRLACVVMLVAGVLLAPAVKVGGAAAGAGELGWQPYDAAEVAAAVSAGGPVILDFYADWCAPCKELDAITFADPSVREELAGYSRFKVDLTRSSKENLELQETYEVRGVPTVIVYRGGAERFRITGFEPPDRFLGRLAGAAGSAG